MEKISWTNSAKNEEVLHRVKEERNILRATKQRKTIWTDHILPKNCLLKHAKERQNGTRTREKDISSYWNLLKAEGNYGNFKGNVLVLQHTLWRIRFVRCYGPIARETKQYVSSKNLTVESTKMNCVGLRVALNCILHKYDVKLRVGLKWLRAGSNSYFFK